MLDIGQIAEVILTKDRVTILKIFEGRTEGAATIYEVRLADYKKVQLFDFELRGLNDGV